MKLYAPDTTKGKRIHRDMKEARKNGMPLSHKQTLRMKKAARQAAKIECKQELE